MIEVILVMLIPTRLILHSLIGGVAVAGLLIFDVAAEQKIQQKDFADKVEDVRRSIERGQQAAPQRPDQTDVRPIDLCKRNPRLPQCQGH